MFEGITSDGKNITHVYRGTTYYQDVDDLVQNIYSRPYLDPSIYRHIVMGTISVVMDDNSEFRITKYDNVGGLMYAIHNMTGGIPVPKDIWLQEEHLSVPLWKIIGNKSRISVSKRSIVYDHPLVKELDAYKMDKVSG